MKIIKWGSGVLVAALVLQFVITLLLPNALMSLLWAKLTKHPQTQAVVANHMSHGDLADEHSRMVVRPSPDLLYSICPYDLSEGALEISGQVPNSYWSLQFYAMNTDNFAGISNTRKQANRAGKPYKITLIAEGKHYTGNSETIEAPNNKGMALIRIAVIGQPVEQLHAIQQQANCRIIPYT